MAGLRDFEASGWFGVCGPKGLPEPLVARQNAAFNRSLANAEVQARLRSAGATVLGGASKAFGDFNRREVPRWSALIRRLGVSVD